MRLLSLVGARPQFVKAAVICRALSGCNVTHRLVHTGQHYDHAMNGVFFEDLGIPAPEHNLNVGSGSHAMQTAEMMKRLEPVLEAERPDWLIVYGDTNSTLAGVLTASKMHIRCAHIEAGLRSGNREMPEETNRIVADHLSDLLFCPTVAAHENLIREGLAGRALIVGDVMYDAVLAFRHTAGASAAVPPAGDFALATLHRAANTDDPERLSRILAILDEIASNVCPVILPVHPRTRARTAELGWVPEALRLVPPLPYPDMLALEQQARFILTDSGGVQKEAYFLRTPCITLREETEWTETLENGCNVLAGSDREKVLRAIAATGSAGPWTAAYGDGSAGVKIVARLIDAADPSNRHR